MLKDDRLPSYDILAILHSIRLLLVDPNRLSPANLEASIIYRDNRVEYNRKVLQTMIMGKLKTVIHFVKKRRSFLIVLLNKYSI